MNITIRPLQLGDLRPGTGYFETLENLSECPPLDEKLAAEIFDYNNRFGKETLVAIIDSGQIVGTASWFPEWKYTHGGGKVAHIEDVVVRKDLQGQHIGDKLMRAIRNASVQHKPYKSILDCSEDNIPFYSQLGYAPHEVCMRQDH